jgi:hypothetical protein
MSRFNQGIFLPRKILRLIVQGIEFRERRVARPLFSVPFQ